MVQLYHCACINFQHILNESMLNDDAYKESKQHVAISDGKYRMRMLPKKQLVAYHFTNSCISF